MNVATAVVSFVLGVFAFLGTMYLFNLVVGLLSDNLTVFYTGPYNLFMFIFSALPAILVFFWGIANLKIGGEVDE